SKEEVLGRPIFDMYQSDSNEDAKKAFKSFVETGEVRDFELQLERKDGNKIDVSLNASAVRDEDGNVLYSRSVWRDITEHKKVEEKLTIKNRELQTFYDAAVGRELKVIELKKEINELFEKSGEKPKYDIIM
ncbi:MAG: PAS domain-containing protein, partial [Ignavibacteriaceae bacterium]